MVCTTLGSLLRPLFYFLCYIHFSLSVLVHDSRLKLERTLPCREMFFKMFAKNQSPTHVDLDDGVDVGGVDEPRVGEVPPVGVPKVLDGAEGDDLARGVRLGVGPRLGRVRAADVVPHLGRLRDQRVQEPLHLRRLAQRLLVVQGLRVQGWKNKKRSCVQSNIMDKTLNVRSVRLIS